LLFLPYLAGERSPIWDEKARGVFVGIDLQTRADTMLQAMYQGVGFAIRQTLESMGQGIRCVRAVGGANRNDKWLQIKANISGIRYERMIELDASAFGAALIAAIGSGIYKKSDFDTFIQPQTVFEPELKAKPEYDSLFSSYKALYGKLRETFEEMYVCTHS
jgi:xylulokinase